MINCLQTQKYTRENSKLLTLKSKVNRLCWPVISPSVKKGEGVRNQAFLLGDFMEAN